MKKALLGACVLVLFPVHSFAAEDSARSFSRTYANYQAMRDALADKIYAAQREVLLRTPSLQDNEIALSLIGIKTRGLIIEVSLDPTFLKSPFSRYASLKQMEVPVNLMEANKNPRTYVTIDDESYVIHSSLQTDISGEVKVEAAKAPTRPSQRPLLDSATIKKGSTNLKNSSQFRMVQQQLPRETRAERIRRGKPVSDLNGSSRQPAQTKDFAAPSREMDIVDEKK